MAKHLQETNVKTINGNSIVGTGNISITSEPPFYVNLYIDIPSLTVPSNVNLLQTSGYGTVGRGAAKYVRSQVTGSPSRFRTQSVDGAWWELAEDRLHIDMFGAIGDGLNTNGPNNQTAIQVAIDYATTGTSRRGGRGAVLNFDNGGDYKVSGQLTLKNGVVLSDYRMQNKGGFNVTTASSAAITLVPGSLADDLYFITTTTNASGWGINGLQIVGEGLGVASRTGGIRTIGVSPTDWRITNCTIKGWGIEGAWVTGTPYTFQFNMVQALNNYEYINTRTLITGLTRETGAFRAEGADGSIFNNEFTGSANQVTLGEFVVTDPNHNCNAAHYGNLGVSKLAFNIYQVAESGLRHPGSLNRYTSERFDTNAGHGVFFSSGGDNTFIACQIIRNSLAGTNTYDGIYVTDGIRNTWIAPSFGTGTTVGSPPVSYQQRYFINDQKTTLNQEDANSYLFIKFYGSPGTDFVNFNESSAEWNPRFTTESAGMTRVTGNSATPSVFGKKILRMFNSTATTITNFTKGLPGQEIFVVGDNANGAATILSHTASGTGIRLRSGVNTTLTLSMDKVVHLINRGTYNSPVWLEIGDNPALGILSSSIDIALNASHYTVAFDTATGNKVATLPDATTNATKIFNIKKADASGNTLTIQVSGGGTIDGVTTKVLNTAWASLTVQSTGSSYIII